MGLSHTFFPTDPQAMRVWMPKPCKLSNPSASLLRITLLSHGGLWTSNSAPALPHPLCHDSYALAMAGFHSPLHLPGRHPLHLDLLRDRTPPWRSRQAPHMDPMPSLCLPIQSQPLSTRAPLPSMRRTQRTPPHQNTLTNSRNFTVPLRPVTERRSGLVRALFTLQTLIFLRLMGGCPLRSKWRDDLRVVSSLRREAPSPRYFVSKQRQLRRKSGRRRSIALQKIERRCRAAA